MGLEKQIIKSSSTTHYFSSKFFPKKIRRDVFRLYSFVRVADDYVDKVPAQPEKFYDLRRSWDKAVKALDFDVQPLSSDSIDTRIIKNIVSLVPTYGIEPKWVDSFLNSMAADLDKNTFKTIDDTLKYIYGSSEVIGLMMAKIMSLPDESHHAAKLQGRTMQYLNFIRDIEEDNQLGRCYFPKEDLEKFGLSDLQKATALKNPENFSKFIDFQLQRYDEWQDQATKGFHFIPPRLRVPLQTAVDMFNWTAEQIKRDPFQIYEHKIKPKKCLVFSRGVNQLFTIKL